MSSRYVELHARSAFSFLEGASLPEDLVSGCAEFDQPAMAITDMHGVYGAPRFHLAAKQVGIRALIGAEMNAGDKSRYTLLVENRKGYQNLCRLITRTKFRDGGAGKVENPYATAQDFAEYAQGIVCLTGGEEGALAQIFRTYQGPAAADEARKYLQELACIFGQGNIYVELQRHYRRDQEARNQALVDLACSLNFPLLATNGVTHATPERRDLPDALTCLRHKTTLAEAGRLLNFNAERHLKTSAQMSALFADLQDALGNTCELAARLQFTLTDLGYEFPRYLVPAGETEMSYLKQLTDTGARRRYFPYHESAQWQVERELALIDKLNLAGYFLIVWDIVDFCRRQNILVQGRGSAANRPSVIRWA